MFILYTYTQCRCEECGEVTNIAPGKVEKFEFNCVCKPIEEINLENKEREANKASRKTQNNKNSME